MFKLDGILIMYIKKLLFILLFLPTFVFAEEFELDDTCVINVLNRTVSATGNGDFTLPNVPSNMGLIRARATCVREDKTISAQTDYFSVTNNQSTNVGEFKTKEQGIPKEILLNGLQEPINVFGINELIQINAQILFSDGTTAAASQENGANYISSNSAIFSVGENGLLTSLGNGEGILTIRKDGVLRIVRVNVFSFGDADGDGIPDEYETLNGLDPTDPIDAFEDQDNDGLSALEEFDAGTNPFVADTDEDGIKDGEELIEGEDGFITSPLLADSDGDSLSDAVEIVVGSDPNDSADTDMASALVSISSSPSSVVITFNAIDSETSAQLAIKGVLIDGSEIDLTASSTGTNYSSSDLSVASFGLIDGKVFGGQGGNAVVTVTNNGKQTSVSVLVKQFEAKALSAVSIPGYANNVDVNGDYAFVAAGSAGLQVVDVSDRSAPTVVASLDTDGTAIDIKVLGSLVYIADGESGLVVIDIADPLTPTLVSSFDTAGVTQDLQVDFNYAYLANGSTGIEIVDISEPSKLTSVATLQGLGTVRGIDIEGDRSVVVADNSLIVLDVTDKQSPMRIGSVNISQAKDVVIDGDYAHVAAYSSGYRVVNISNPASPFIEGGQATIAPRDVHLTRDFAFYAEQLFPNVVAFVNIFDPSNPVFQGTINLSGFGDYAGTGISLDASYAYITEENYVVRADYGTSGNTKLFIAQYRDINDNNGVSPTVSLTTPTEGQVVVEGRRFTISANADDDIAVAKVDFFINGELVFQDSTSPYQLSYTVTGGLALLQVSATATDLGGNTADTILVNVTVQPDGDDDGLGDNEEVDTYSTDPENPDSDSDGLLDGDEIALGTDPNDKDSDDDGIEDNTEVLNQTDPLNPDITSPIISETDPADGATEIPENSSISIKFNEPLLAKSVTNGSLSLLKEGTTDVAGNLKLISSNTELLFTPDALMADLTAHTVKLIGLRDMAGNLIDDTTEFGFTTGNLIDTTRPEIADINPTNNAVDVPVNAALTVIMSEAINPGTVTDESFVVIDLANSLKIPGIISVNDDKTVISFVPNAAFLVGRQHRVYLSSEITDLFGNNLSGTYRYFTTSFELDGDAPLVEVTNISHGDVNVPLNAKLIVRFDEPINALYLSKLKLKLDGVDVATAHVLANDRRTVTLTPNELLTADSSYTLDIDNIQDLSGNLIPSAVVIGFNTGAESDTTQGAYTSFTPTHNTIDAPLNIELSVRLNERVAPTSVSTATFYLQDLTVNKPVQGQTTLSEGNTRLSFTPNVDLLPYHKYRLYWSYGTFLLDLAGNRIGSYHYTDFTTSDSAVGTSLTVVPSFVDGAAEMPLNTRLVLNSERLLSPLCVSDTVATLTGGASPLTLDAALLSQYQLALTVPENLLASTSYQLTVTGVCDYSGNELAAYTITFTTGTDTEADTAYPRVSTVSPLNTAIDVAANSNVVITFDEIVDPHTLASIEVRVNGLTGNVAGDFTASGNVVTFTPLDPFPGEQRINVYVSKVADFSGNAYTSRQFSSYFTTAPNLDNQVPTVVSVSPADNSLDINPSQPVVITFSESLDSSTLNNTHFVYWANGALITPTVYRSTDNRTVTLNASLPSESLVTLIVTNNVKDLSGNVLADFTSIFTTGVADTDRQRPSIVRQYPTNGATQITDKIVLYSNERLDSNSITDAFHIAQNGILISGTTTISVDGQVIEFVPDNTFESNALVHIYLQSTATDLSDNALYNYQTYFRTPAEVGDLIGVRPTPVIYSPTNGSTDIPLNPKLQVRYNEILDASTVNDTNVMLLDANGITVDATVNLAADGMTIMIAPVSLLIQNAYYYVRVTDGVADTEGDASYYYSGLFGFTTGETAVEDTQSPTVLMMSPANGSTNVPLNAQYYVRVNERLNPLSFPVDAGLNVMFSANDKEVSYAPVDIILPMDSEVTESVPTMTDIAGNQITTFSTTFNTANSINLDRVSIIKNSPISGATDVAVNTSMAVKLSTAIDPVSITSDGVYLRDSENNTVVAATVNLAPDGKTITIIPDEALKVGRRYYYYIYYLRDLAGNSTYNNSYYFDTSFETDSTAPVIEGISLVDGQIDIPTNMQLRIRFNEPINNVSFFEGEQVFIEDANNVRVPFNTSLDASQTELLLIPAQVLAPNSNYSLTIQDITDRSGNALATSTNIQFTTASSIDNQIGVYTDFTPKNGTTNAPLNIALRVRLSERIDPLTMNASSFYLQDLTLNKRVVGVSTLSENDTHLSFVPNVDLLPYHKYRLYWSYGTFLLDLAGNRVGSYHYTDFTTGDTAVEASLSVEPSFVDGATEMPLNTRLVLHSEQLLSSLCADDTIATLTGGASPLTLDAVLLNQYQLALTVPEDLLASTAYQINITGVCDYAGNQLPEYTIAFTTGTGTEADTAYPRVSTVSPVNTAIDIAANSNVVITFDEAVDPHTLTSIEIRVNGLTGNVAGDFTVSGNVVTFTPLDPFPGEQRINVYVSKVADFSGNAYTSRQFSSYFTTAPNIDNQVPTVVSVSPADASLDVRPNQPVVITFSESLDSSTVNNNHFFFWVNGSLIQPSVYRSTDNRTVTLNASLPSETIVTLIVTNEVKDLSGNNLADFASIFTTGVVDTDTQRPSIVRQYPANGATQKTEKIVLYSNERLDSASITNAFYVVQNGVPISGSTSVLVNGQVIEFVPDNTFESNALIHIYLQSTATDLSGNALYNYKTTFTTPAEVGDLIGVRPTPVIYSPTNSSADIPLNPKLQVRYNEILDATTVNDTNVLLLDANGVAVDAAVNLAADGVTITIEAVSLLAQNAYYYVRVTDGVMDTEGDASYYYSGLFGFTTGETAVEDTQSPTVLMMSPADGSNNVPLNAKYYVRVDERLNPLSFPSNAGLNVTFAANDREISYSPITINLPKDSAVTENVPSVTDIAGNQIVAFSSTFNTANNILLDRASVIQNTPVSGATDVAVSTYITAKLSAEVDPVSITESGVYLRDTVDNTTVAASVSLSNDGTTITLVPDDALTLGQRYYYYIYYLRDLAGNSINNNSFYFDTALVSDSTAPTIEAISLIDGQTGLPTNSKIRIRFDEPINKVSLFEGEQVFIEDAGSTRIPFNMSLNASQTELILTPTQVLSANTTYSLTVQDVEDRSSNVLASPVNIDFTTGDGIDHLTGSILFASPFTAAVNVPVNTLIEASLSEAMDPETLTSDSFYLYDNTDAVVVAGVLGLSENNTRITLTPTANLTADHEYSIFASYNYASGINFLLDHAGNIIGRTYAALSTFTAGSGSDTAIPAIEGQSIADGLTDVPTNARFVVKFDADINLISVGDSITLEDQSNVPQAFTWAYDKALTLLRVTPTNALDANTTFTFSLNGTEDFAGNQIVSAFSTSFSTGASTDTTQGSIIERAPLSNATNVPIDTKIEFLLDEPIDPLSLNSTSFRVNDKTDAAYDVTGTLSLSVNNTKVTFTPSTNLDASHEYEVYISYRYYNDENAYLKDYVGNRVGYHTAIAMNFTTGTDVDSSAPLVSSTSVIEGQTGVPINARFVIEFDEDINHITLVNNITLKDDLNTVFDFSWSYNAGLRLITLLPDTDLSTNTAYTITINGVEDYTGNQMTTAVTTSFTTGTESDTSQGSIALISPINGASLVPTNTLIEVLLSEAIDPLSLNATSFRVYDRTDTAYDVTGTLSLSEANTKISFVPTSELDATHEYELYLSYRYFNDENAYLHDYSGNRVGYSTAFAIKFTVAEVADTTAPTVNALSLADAQVDVPLNARLVLEFDEAVNTVSLANSLNLKDDLDVQQPMSWIFNPGLSLYNLIPDAELDASTLYTLTVNGTEDYAGNVQTPAFVSTFTTSAVTDTAEGTILTDFPLNDATGVLANTTIEVTLSEAIDPLSLSSTSFRVYDRTDTAYDVTGTLALSDGNTKVTFTPSSDLDAGHVYEVYVSYRYFNDENAYLHDFSGNRVGYHTSYASKFTVAP